MREAPKGQVPSSKTKAKESVGKTRSRERGPWKWQEKEAGVATLALSPQRREIRDKETVGIPDNARPESPIQKHTVYPSPPKTYYFQTGALKGPVRAYHLGTWGRAPGCPESPAFRLLKASMSRASLRITTWLMMCAAKPWTRGGIDYHNHQFF